MAKATSEGVTLRLNGDEATYLLVLLGGMTKNGIAQQLTTDNNWSNDIEARWNEHGEIYQALKGAMG